MKILFITANRVGDAVLTTGLLAWMERRYSDAAFTIVCGPYAADLFRATPRLERLIVMKKKKYNLHWFSVWLQCFDRRWDLIVDLRNSVVSRFLFAKKRARHRSSSGRHKVVDNGAVLKLAPPPDPQIWLRSQAIEEAKRLVPEGAQILALGPAANWPPKQWPIEHFIALVKKLTATGQKFADARIMVISEKREREQVAALLQAIPDAQRIDIIGYDLQTVAACLQRARLFIGNDLGLMHLSAALGVPTLGLFGPGQPEIYRPWGEKCAYVTTPESRKELWPACPTSRRANRI